MADDPMHKEGEGEEFLPRTSRRGFLKGVGLAAGAAASGTLITHRHALAEPESQPAIPGLVEYGSGPREITLSINGESNRLTVEPRTTLLEALRLNLDLTGSKEICDRGACGGCSVLLDGRAINSCLFLAIDAVGHSVTTVEGIAADPKRAALVDAFCECDAAQCGYCTPGFLVRSADLLDHHPNPTYDEIREALAGNACRCGAHSMIFEAVAKAAGKGAGS